MKLAIIGTGISGLVAAHRLHGVHDVTVFEADDRIGGHTHTIEVPLEGRTWPVDTGFIVFNHKTYPHFTELLAELGIASQPTTMSFSFTCAQTGLEYKGQTLDTLFAQRRNLLRPSFLRMVREIFRFNRQLGEWLAEHPDDTSQTLGAYLREGGYSEAFIDHYVIPMGAAIWSAGREAMMQFPLLFFGRFFDNHGMLSIHDRPQWRVIENGSKSYVDALIEPFADRIHTSTPITGITRLPDCVMLETAHGVCHSFDAVISAVHSDQALRMLRDPSRAEREILGAIPYQENEAVLHTDESILPKRRKAWAAWNYHLLDRDRARVAVTYDMNMLQSLDAPRTFCVTLNATERIDPTKIIRAITYHHPLFTSEGVRAQARVPEINGVNKTYFCGAWCFYGFHEDGVRSGLRVAEEILAAAPEPVGVFA